MSSSATTQAVGLEMTASPMMTVIEYFPDFPLKSWAASAMSSSKTDCFLVLETDSFSL